MATANDLIRVARAEVGNTSGKKYWDAYWRGSWSYVNGDVTPYCACFVTWCLNQAGVTAPHFPSAVAFDWRDVGGRGIAPYALSAGDLVAFDWDGDESGDHVGIIEVAHGGGVYTTIEGNTSGGVVARKTRYASQIICGIAPYYKEDEEVTEKEMQHIAEMAANMTVQKLSAKNSTGVSLAGRLVWGAKNTSLETRDAYQILRDIRNALGINDGQLVKASTEMNVGYEKSVIKVVVDALSAIKKALNIK